jgi:hypothetical protein
MIDDESIYELGALFYHLMSCEGECEVMVSTLLDKLVDGDEA